MNELRELYQEVILDHNKRPRNFGVLPGFSGRAEGYNPLCGDRVSVAVLMDGDVVEDVRFEGAGCAISQASASLMTESVKGRTICQTNELFQQFHQMVTGDGPVVWAEEKLEPLSALAGVREFPIRIKCATLPWHTLLAALENDSQDVSTE